jgi:hypothetical protein
MEMMRKTDPNLSHDLIDAIQALPLSREIAHCGQTFAVPPFDLYANCPQCAAHIKVRSFTGLVDIEDVFDAVFAWMNQPGAESVVRQRQKVIAENGE